jgi:hypothetical protein
VTLSAKRLALAIVSMVVAFTSATPALADDAVGASYVAPSPTLLLPGEKVTPRDAVGISARQPVIVKLRRAHRGVKPYVFFYRTRQWSVIWSDHNGKHDLAEVDIDAVHGKVAAIWTGPQTDDPLARGHFGHMFDSPFVWIPLSLLFIAPFFDFRRPLRLLHFDLLALLAFGVSHLFFNQGNVFASVPLVYPVLGYLLVRMLVLGLKPHRRRDRLVPHAPTAVLAVLLGVAIVGRIALNVLNNWVIDVGYASVVGAYRVMHHLPLYVISQFHGDTYGPLNYVAYVPFETIWPWHGKWDAVPAAHAAAIAFDLLTIAALFVLGRKLRSGRAGTRLGLALALAWTAYPYTLYPLALNTNDTLVALLGVLALLTLASPARRSAMVALAAAAKLSPLALIPLIAAGRGERRRRSMTIGAAVTVAILGLSLLLYAPNLGTFWHDTIAFQLHRTTNFSVWAQHPALHPLQLVLIAAAIGLGIAVAFVPRRRDLLQVAALAGAVTIAFQIPVKHWFYLYVVWFAPFVLVALLGQHSTDPARPAPDEIETSALLEATSTAPRL